MIENFLERNRGKKTFLEHEVKGILKEMGLPVPRLEFVKKGETMPQLDLSYPLVAKVSSSKITSKSDIHGVLTGLKNNEELEAAVTTLMQIPDAEGVLIEEMATHGLEVIIGGVIDKQFGPVVMFGMGGVLAELFKDVAFGLAPLKKEEALWLISQVKGNRLLKGYRGSPPVDIDALVDIIVKISEFIATRLLGEIDLNPVALYPHGAIILDAKMRLISR
ncbi:MAG: acetate--CoA ligase family protein [Nitrospirae bacterium]|nr:acetate--CoA ligase family protein [Nitrospirota bacterium]